MPRGCDLSGTQWSKIPKFIKLFKLQTVYFGSMLIKSWSHVLYMVCSCDWAMVVKRFTPLLRSHNTVVDNFNTAKWFCDWSPFYSELSLQGFWWTKTITSIHLRLTRDESLTLASSRVCSLCSMACRKQSFHLVAGTDTVESPSSTTQYTH